MQARTDGQVSQEVWPMLLRGLLIAVILLFAGAAGPVRGETQEIRITATQFSYSPPRAHVNLGDRVTLRIVSQDVTHGIYVDGYGLMTKVYPFREAVVTFVADRPGKIRYRCAVVCGYLHPFMVGEILVEPNRPLWLSMAVAVLLAAGVVTILWRKMEA